MCYSSIKTNTCDIDEPELINQSSIHLDNCKVVKCLNGLPDIQRYAQ